MQKVLAPIQRVRFTKSTLRHASIREKKGPSLGTMNVKVLHHRSPNAMKFGYKSHEETEQQRCARSKAWNLAKNFFQAQRKRHGCIPFSRGTLNMCNVLPVRWCSPPDFGAKLQGASGFFGALCSLCG